MPSDELRRARLMKELRASYADACKATLGLQRPPSDSLDRWMLEQLAQEKDGKESDPLLPKPRIAIASRVLERELLAEVPMRCPSRLYGKPARDALRVYHQSAARWVVDGGKECQVPPSLNKGVEALGQWLEEHASIARGRAAECPFKAKLRELSGEGGLTAQFARWGPIQARAVRVLEAVSVAAEKVVAEMSRPREPSAPCELDVVLEVVQDEPHVSLRCGGDELLVSALHHQKLAALYELHNPRPAGGKDRAAWDALFRRRMYVMVKRYMTFIGLDPSQDGSSGGNMHAAAPESVFACLKERLEVRCEMFASPLNCYFSTFFSAFPDIDCFFGSRGSFFDVEEPPPGSYEVGPPYTEEVLKLMADRLLKFLRQADSDDEPKALSFVIFVPDWPGAEGLDLMDGPEFAGYRRARQGWTPVPFVLAQGREHHYITGVQFFAGAGADAQKRYYTVPHGTRVYVMQSAAGAVRWPYTHDDELALLERLRPR